MKHSPCLTYNLARPSWGLHLMGDIHDRLDLHDLRTVGGGFIVYALSKDVTLHRAQCCEIDPLYSTPSEMKFFETHSEAGQWLLQQYRLSWSHCAVCCPPTSLPINSFVSSREKLVFFIAHVTDRSASVLAALTSALREVLERKVTTRRAVIISDSPVMKFHALRGSLLRTLNVPNPKMVIDSPC